MSLLYLLSFKLHAWMIYRNPHSGFCKIHFRVAGRFLPGLELHQAMLCSKLDLVPDSFWAARAHRGNPRIAKVSPSSHPANAGKMLAISRLLQFFQFFSPILRNYNRNRATLQQQAASRHKSTSCTGILVGNGKKDAQFWR